MSKSVRAQRELYVPTDVVRQSPSSSPRLVVVATACPRTIPIIILCDAHDENDAALMTPYMLLQLGLSVWIDFEIASAITGTILTETRPIRLG
jgi:hypothetical protein